MRWLQSDDAWVSWANGRLPRSKIAATVGRSPQAVQIRLKRLGVPPLTDHPQLFTAPRLARLMGWGCHKSAALWLDRRLPSALVYLGDTPVLAVWWRELRRWLLNPLNWYGLNVGAIRDERVLELVTAVASAWDDEWLSIGAAAREFYYSDRALSRAAREGRLSGRFWSRWWFLRSDVVAYARRWA